MEFNTWPLSLMGYTIVSRISVEMETPQAHRNSKTVILALCWLCDLEQTKTLFPHLQTSLKQCSVEHVQNAQHAIGMWYMLKPPPFCLALVKVSGAQMPLQTPPSLGSAWGSDWVWSDVHMGLSPAFPNLVS
jgi:hypothetical protein